MISGDRSHWFLYVFTLTGVEPALVRAPENAAVAQGSEVTLDCSSDIGTAFLTWFNRSCPRYDDLNDCARSSVIYNGFNDRDSPPRFTIVSANNATDMTRNVNIHPTQLSDASVYVCVENIRAIGVQQTRSAQLVILGTTNVAAFNILSCRIEDTYMSCRISILCTIFMR